MAAHLPKPSFSLADVAVLAGTQFPSVPESQELFLGASVVMLGFGSLARPLARFLFDHGVRCFTLVDPKVHAEHSVAGQCSAAEVGELKVSAGGTELRERSARVSAYPRDLYNVPDGIIGPDSIVVACLDNRRADIGANRLAARMGARFLRLNVEPALDIVAARVFDYRGAISVCAECQFTDAQYAAQRHPRSCDGGGPARSTNSPRWLSVQAAQVGLLALIDAQRGGPHATRWLRRESLYLVGDSFQRSLLAPNPRCRWDHQQRWALVERVGGPDSVSLQDLARSVPWRVGPETVVRFCQRVAVVGRCAGCGREVHGVWWLNDLRAAVGACTVCGGAVNPLPFYTHHALPVRHLGSVFSVPLARWGVEPRSVIEFTNGERASAFVVGSPEFSQPVETSS